MKTFTKSPAKVSYTLNKFKFFVITFLLTGIFHYYSDANSMLNMTSPTFVRTSADIESISTSLSNPNFPDVTVVPGVPTFSGTTTICRGNSTTISATSSNATAIVWYTGSCGGTFVATSNSITVSPSANITYFARGWNSTSGYGTCGNVLITVNAKPTASPNFSANPICSGLSTTLSANAAAGSGSISSYSWSSGLGNVASGSVSTAGTYTVTVTNTNGCSVIATSPSLTVNALPSNPAPSASPTTICNAGSSTLSASVTGATIYWYTGSCGGSYVATGNSITVSPTSNTTYYAKAYNTSTGCWSSDCGSVTVNVNTLPSTPSNQAASYSTICVGGTSSLSASVTGSTIYWYTGGCGVNQVGTGNTIDVSPTSTTTYYARANNGCWSSSCGGVTVNVNADPSISASGATSICSGNTATLSTSVSGGAGTQTYQWESSPDNITWTVISGATNSTYTTPALANSTYYRCQRISDGNGCDDPYSNSVLVTVNSTPDPSNQAATPSTICGGGSSSLSASVSGATIYWYYGSCGGTYIATGNSVTVSPTSNMTYYAKAYNTSTGCWSSGCGNVTVNVNTLPSTPSNQTASPSTICVGGTSSLSASVSGSTIYWYTGGCGVNQVGTGNTIDVSPASNTTYYARANNGCWSSGCGSVAITINPVPSDVTVSPNSSTQCEGSVTLTASGGTGGTMYWQGTTYGGTSISTPSNSQTVTSSGNYYFNAYNSCGWGNQGSAAVVITPPSDSDSYA